MIQDVFESRDNRFLHIDGLRALSVIWMIGFHSVFYFGFFLSKEEYLPLLGQQQHFRLLLEGLLGVDVFFAISGFLIASILLNEIGKYGSVQLGKFYLRRFFRIMPAYLASLLLCRSLLGEFAIENIWANFFLINNYIPIDKQFMGWTWSLAVEGQFYLLFPIFLIAFFKFTKRPALLFFLLMLGSLAGRYLVIKGYGMQELLPLTPFFDKAGFSRWFDNWYDKTHLRCSGILVGCLAAFFYSDSGFKRYFNGPKIFTQLLLVLSGFYLIWSITSEQTCAFDYCSGNAPASSRVLYETLKHFMVSLITATLILYCAGPGRRGRINQALSSKIWRPFAEVSLSAFLLHPLIIVVFYSSILRAGFRLTPSIVPYCIIAIELITFFLSFVMVLVIEMPFRKLGRRIVANPRSS